VRDISRLLSFGQDTVLYCGIYDITPCSLVRGTNLTQKDTASVFTFVRRLNTVGREAGCQRIVVRFQTKLRDVVLFETSTPAVGPTQPPTEWAPGSFPGIQRPGRTVYHSAPSNAEIKNKRRYTWTPPIYLTRTLPIQSCSWI
jgi:hypothetical protein